MHKLLLLLLLTSAFVFLPDSILLAEGNGASDTQAVAERANNLKNILDRLLAQSNHSSIQKVINEGGDSSDPLIAEAMQLKASGEQLLDEQEYLKAAMTLQAALDRVFQAIRSHENYDASEAALEARITEAKAANDTFIAAATRVVNGDPEMNAGEYLTMAREARDEADSVAAKGDLEAALEELNKSTDLAQQAIMSVRNGMVIERGQ